MIDDEVMEPPHTDKAAASTPKRRPQPKADTQPKPKHPGGRPRTKLTTNEVLGEIETLHRLVISVWSMRDPFCAAVADEQLEAILNAWKIMLDTNPRVRDSLQRAAKGAGYLPLVMAYMPLAMAVVAHHVTRSVPPEVLAEFGPKGDEQPAEQREEPVAAA